MMPLPALFPGYPVPLSRTTSRSSFLYSLPEKFCKYIGWTPLKAGKAGAMREVKAELCHHKVNPWSYECCSYLEGKMTWGAVALKAVFVSRSWCYDQPTCSRPGIFCPYSEISHQPGVDRI